MADVAETRARLHRRETATVDAFTAAVKAGAAQLVLKLLRGNATVVIVVR